MTSRAASRCTISSSRPSAVTWYTVRAGRWPTFSSRTASISLAVKLAQLGIQCAAGDAAQYLGVGQLGGAPDLVIVHRPAFGQLAEDHQAAKIHYRLVCTY